MLHRSTRPLLIALSALLALVIAPAAFAQGPTPAATLAPAPTAAPTAVGLPQAVAPPTSYDITAPITQLEGDNLPTEYLLGVSNIVSPTKQVSLTLTVTNGEVLVLVDPRNNAYQRAQSGQPIEIKVWNAKTADAVQLSANNATYTLMLTANADPASYSLTIQSLTTTAQSSQQLTSGAPAPLPDTAPGDFVASSNPLGVRTQVKPENGQQSSILANINGRHIGAVGVIALLLLGMMAARRRAR